MRTAELDSRGGGLSMPARSRERDGGRTDPPGPRVGLVVASLLACGRLGASVSEAHPVSQGALEVVILGDRVHVRASVSSEEVLVASAYGGQKKSSALETVRGHGAYLLAHLQVRADGYP